MLQLPSHHNGISGNLLTSDAEVDEGSFTLMGLSAQKQPCGSSRAMRVHA